jgi:hypothetical protein
MTETEATPRPWHWTKSQAFRILRGPDDLYIGSISYVAGYEAREANAELIVTAVNEHDALMARVDQLEKALREARDVLALLVPYGKIHTVEGVRYPDGSHSEAVDRAEIVLNKLRALTPREER